LTGGSKVRVYNRVPTSYSSQGTPYGSNAELYSDVISELKAKLSDLKEVHLTMNLFNNMHLYSELLSIAEKSVRVVVTSLPLTGYKGGITNEANHVYNQVLKDEKIELRIFPHMYIWHGAKYAGGGPSYSLHIKAGLMEYKDGTAKIFLTSGNLAPGDPTHSETAVFVDAPQGSPYFQSFKTFFNEIEQRTKHFKEFSKAMQGLSSEQQELFAFSLVGGTNVLKLEHAKAQHAFFTAPFITIADTGSNHYARKRLVDIITSARHRVFICAQHVHDLHPFDGYAGQTITQAIIKAKKTSLGMDIRVLKQVPSSGLEDKRKAAFLECHLHHAGVGQKVNRLIHDKFIVADNATVITTGNFTSTQFGWGEVQMRHNPTDDQGVVQGVIDCAKNFFTTPKDQVWASMTRPRKKAPTVKVLKNDVFSEVNAFTIFEDPGVANQMASYFDSLWNHSLSRNVEILT